MTILQGYPKINDWMFINDWNANVASSILAKVYKLKTVDRVNSYVQKLRRQGHVLITRKKGARAKWKE